VDGGGLGKTVEWEKHFRVSVKYQPFDFYRTIIDEH
jgi:hypothetical protein